MGSKVFSIVALLYLSISLVNGYFEFEAPSQALDLPLYEEVLDEELCTEQLNVIRKTPYLTTYFADAGIRVPRGILQGNTLDMGNYHQCINFNHQLSDSQLQGKYCVIDVPIEQNFEFTELPSYLASSNFDPSSLSLDEETIRNLREYNVMKNGMKIYTGAMDDNGITPELQISDLKFTLSVCIPKTCTTRQAFDNFLSMNSSAVGLQYSDVYCRLANDKPRRPGDYIGIAIFSLLGIITIASTTYELWHTFVKNTEPKKINVMAKSFSVYTNGRRLMTFTPGPESVECIDGIRTLAMTWVMFGHAFAAEIAWANPIDVFEWTTSWQSLWVRASHYSVDTFFTISGFLVVYTTVGKLTSKNLLKNLHLFYLNRILRMFPLLAATILLEATLLNRFTDGPDWSVVGSQVNRCRATWWSTLLYVQNFLNPGSICVGQTWYLAVDVQLHILCPLILVWVLWGKKKYAWTALGVAFFGVFIASTIFVFVNKFPHVLNAIGREPESQRYLFYYYINTFTRSPPFFVGMAFGYAVRVLKIKLTGVSNFVFWAVIIAVFSFLVYFNYPINQVSWENQFMTSFYNAFFRTFWAIALGCLIYACVHGFGGPVNWFLSLQVWKIHSRLSYAMYLVHYMLMVSVNSTIIAPLFFSPDSLMFKCLAHYTYALAVSFLLTLVIDSPFSILFKRLLGGGPKKAAKKDELTKC